MEIESNLLIVAGNFQSIIYKNGILYASGYNTCGQLGVEGFRIRTLFEEIDIKRNFEIKDIVCGESFTLYLTTTGEVYGCGNNIYGQLGLGTEKETRKVTKLLFSNIKEIKCGSHHVLALSYDNILYTTGQCRDSFTRCYLGNTPTIVSGICTKSNQIQIACG